MTARDVARLPDDAPATMFAPGPVSPYAAGFEDAQEPGGRVWFCPWRNGTTEAAKYAAGWQDGKRETEVRQ